MRPLNAAFVNTRKSPYYGSKVFFALPPSKVGAYATYDAVNDRADKLPHAIATDGITGKITNASSTFPFSPGNFNATSCFYLSGSGKHCVLGYSYSSSALALAWTLDGVSWTTVVSSYNYSLSGTLPQPIVVNNVAYFQAIDYGGPAVNILSFDGTSFTLLSTFSGVYVLPKLRYQNGLFYYAAPSYTPAVGTSPDCVTWTAPTDLTILSAANLDVTASGKICFITKAGTSATGGKFLYSNDAGSINGPWKVNPLPLTGSSISCDWLGGERISLSSNSSSYLKVYTEDMGASFNFANSVSPNKLPNWSMDLMINSDTSYAFGLYNPKFTVLKISADRDIAYEMSCNALTAQFKDTATASISLYPISYVRRNTFDFFATVLNNAAFRFFTIELSEASPEVTNDSSLYPSSTDQYSGSISGVKAYTVIGNANPLTEIGVTLSYPPNDSFKLCDGYTTYPVSDVRLKQKYPAYVTTTIYPPATGYSGPLGTGTYVYYPFWGTVMGSAYVNSAWVACVDIKILYTDGYSYTGAQIISTTDNGATWSYGTYIDVSNVVCQGIEHDGVNYFIIVDHTLYLGSAISSLASTGITNAIFVKSFTSSNTIIVNTVGDVYQTTNNGASWSFLSTVGGAMSSYNSRVKKIGTTWYCVTMAGIYSTTDFVTFTLASNQSTVEYAGIVYANGIWMATTVQSGFPGSQYYEVSTDNRVTWSTPFPAEQTVPELLGALDDYILLGPTSSSNSFMITTDGGYTRTSIANQQFEADNNRYITPSRTLDPASMRMPYIPGMYMKIYN